MYWSGYAAALLATVLWGSSFVVNKLLLGELPPLAVQVLRFGLGTVVSLALLALVGRGRSLLPPVMRWRLALVAVGGPALNGLGVTFAIPYVGAGTASLAIMLVPVLTGVLVVAAGQERLTSRKLQGLAVALVGLLIVVLLGAPDRPLAGAQLIGLLCLLLGALGFAIYNVFAKPLFVHYTPLEVSIYFGILSPLSLLPFLVYPPIWQGLDTIGQLSTEGWLLVLYIGLISGTGAYLCWYWALRWLEATRVALFSYLIPVWGLIGAALILREGITWWLPVGVVLVVLGIVLSSWAPRASALAGARRPALPSR